MMEVTTIIDVITQVGFPIACVIALGWFLYNCQNKAEARNEEREDKYIELFKEQIRVNGKFNDSLAKVTSTLESISKDIDDIKTKIDIEDDGK